MHRGHMHNGYLLRLLSQRQCSTRAKVVTIEQTFLSIKCLLDLSMSARNPNMNSTLTHKIVQLKCFALWKIWVVIDLGLMSGLGLSVIGPFVSRPHPCWPHPRWPRPRWPRARWPQFQKCVWIRFIIEVTLVSWPHYMLASCFLASLYAGLMLLWPHFRTASQSCGLT